jgi:hypothetical protein
MSMIDLNGSANRDRLPVDKVLHDAIVDVEDGVEFWKTLGKYRHAKGGHSSEFLNRNG